MTHDHDLHTLAAPYVLHAVPGDEVERFEFHLELCPSCRDEVDDIREIAARLGAAEAVEPPDELKRLVLTAIAAVRPLPPVVDKPGNVSAAPKAPPTLRRWWPRLSIAAAAALSVVVGVLSSTLSDTNRQLADAERLSAQIRQVATAPDMKQATEGSARGKAVVISSRSTDAAVVMPTRMDPVPEDRVYQAWFIHGDNIRSAGPLHGDDESTRPLAVHGLGEATQVGITVEPDGGSDQPTTDPVLLVDLST